MTMSRCLSVLAGVGLIGPAVLGATTFGSGPRHIGDSTGTQAQSYQVEETTIAELHQAIQSGRTTCRAVVQSYIDRARAYNGTCTQLVTRDGSSVSPGTGPMRAGAPVVFPQKTTPVSTVLPEFEQYAGLPLEFGRMAPTRSDPAVQQQYGMVVGIHDAGQINALSTLNLRGERSITCKSSCDAHPSTGPLAASCPVACDAFRAQPDALERAAQLDAQYGRKPDLDRMPMYCVAFSFKDVFDTQDMRSTGGGDVDYAMDAPPADATIVRELRAKGAIIYAKANLDEYNSSSAVNPGGAATLATRVVGPNNRSTWGGQVCNPYDTEREPGGSSSGSAASVGANLAVCSICEETGGSCRQPAWRNGVVGVVTTKGLMPYGGAIGGNPYLDRPGIMCRTVTDTARVLDALKNPQQGYFDPRDIYSALPSGTASALPYTSFTTPTAKGRSNRKPLSGMRIGIVREYMVKHGANDAAMSDQVNHEITQVLRDRLGAEIVESFDPLYPDDPAIPNMAFTFQQALAEILPSHLPDFFQRKAADGTLLYAVPQFDVTKRDYIVKVGEGLAPLSERVNLRSLSDAAPTANFGFDLARYLLRRGDARVRDWESLNAHSTNYIQNRAVATKNWETNVDLASDGISYNVRMRDAMRLVVLKVMRQNALDALVNPTTTIPPVRIGYPLQPMVNDRPTGRYPTSATLGIPEIVVPAGFNRIVFEPVFALNSARSAWVSVANNDRQTLLESPLPVGISFWAGPGDEPALFKIASAYEAATKHRVAPKAFGPLTGLAPKARR